MAGQSGDGDLQARREWGLSFLTAPPAVEPGTGPLSATEDDVPMREQFSVFIDDHIDRAAEVAGQFSRSAAQDDTLAGVEALADSLEPNEPEGLVEHALMMFITHDRAGRVLSIPSLEVRKPDSVLPSRPGTATDAATDAEALLDWWREDPKANEHHEHWHVVYPGSGIRRPPAFEPTLNDRHGELFYYMHRQMLARYNAERLAVREAAVTIADAKVQALSNYQEAIDGGYNPGFPLNQGPRRYNPRPDGGLLSDLAGLSDLETMRDRLMTAATTGTFDDGTPVTADLLGATAEGSRLASNNMAFYGSHHNSGHGFISSLGLGGGVMRSTETAIRDPAFFRWHRHVDDIWLAWQNTQTPHDFADAPNVVAQPPIVVFEESVPDLTDADNWAEQNFGGASFGAADPATTPAVMELETAMFARVVPSNVSQTGMVVGYLDQRPFGYVLQLENPGVATEVTARVFLAPAEDVDDVRGWIEMDKFKVAIESGQNTFYRSASLSSVVKKPAEKPPPVVAAPPPTPDDDENYCSCGWPYNLLLPRGTPEGMAFQLLVMYTDAAVDDVGADRQCGSVSFCGVFDDVYPDTRPMGYPFDRPFAGSVFATLTGLGNVAAQTVDIGLKDAWGGHAADV